MKSKIKKAVRMFFPKSPPEMGGDFVCQLRTTSDKASLIAEIDRYNASRSKEARKPIFDSNRVILFNYALTKVKSLSTGDYAEVGSYRGMTARLIFQELHPDSKLFCFDTFEGFDERDLKGESHRLDVKSEIDKFQNTSLDHVRQTILSAEGDASRLHLVKGWFPASVADVGERVYRFVHLDLDLEDPIRKGLEYFWPLLVPGGIILIHDYLSPQYPGVKIAVDSFCSEEGISIFPWCDRLGTAVIIKNPRS